jgi:hypothetical protein
MATSTASAAVIVRFDDTHGWVDTRTGRPLSADQADTLGLIAGRSVDTPAGPMQVPATAEVFYWPDEPLGLDHLTARLTALLMRCPCEGGCGQHLDTPLRCWTPDGRPLTPPVRRRCALCGLQHTTVVLNHAHGALDGPHRHNLQTGAWIGASTPGSAS